MSQPSIEIAKKRVKVPERRWGSKAEVVKWASEQLAGAPPKLVAIIPPGNESAGQLANWGIIQKGLFANRFVDLESDPPGLIITTESGARFVPRVNRKPIVPGSNPQEVVDSIDAERRLREFVLSENKRVNQEAMSEIEEEVTPEGFRLGTKAFYDHGKRIVEFVDGNPPLTKDRVWKELEKWGRGKAGYSRHHHEYATHMFEWLGPIPETHPVFRFSTTRVQHIIMATTKSDDRTIERNRLLGAMTSGPLKDLTDDQVSWALGKRHVNVPLDEESKKRVAELGARIRHGIPLDSRDEGELRELLDKARSSGTASHS